MARKLFITGMGGMAGRALVNLALEKYQVGGTIHKTLPGEFRTSQNFSNLKCYQLDLKNFSQIKNALLDFQPDTIVHFAGKALGSADSQVFNTQIYNENIIIFENLVKALKKLKVRPRLILTSGCLVYGKPSGSDFRKEQHPLRLPKIDVNKEPYRASRLDQEKLLMKEDLEYIITRPTQFTGVGKISGVVEWYIATQILKILKGQTNEILLKNKLAEVDLLDVRDVARAYIILIEKGQSGQIYHISSGSPNNIAKLANVFLKVVALNPETISIKSTADEKTVYFRFSPEKLNKLGWYPQFSLEDLLLSYWNFFKTKYQT